MENNQNTFTNDKKEDRETFAKELLNCFVKPTGNTYKHISTHTAYIKAAMKKSFTGLFSKLKVAPEDFIGSNIFVRKGSSYELLNRVDEDYAINNPDKLYVAIVIRNSSKIFNSTGNVRSSALALLMASQAENVNIKFNNEFINNLFINLSKSIPNEKMQRVDTFINVEINDMGNYCFYFDFFKVLGCLYDTDYTKIVLADIKRLNDRNIKDLVRITFTLATAVAEGEFKEQLGSITRGTSESNFD